MARRRRRGHRVPWGPDDPAWPDDLVDLEDEDPFGDRPGGHSPGAGGAGVREPRRPKPTLPGLSAGAEPEPDAFLDFTPAG